MTLLLSLMLLATDVLASWTVAYHLALLLQLPSWSTVIPFLAILAALVAWQRRGLSKAIRCSGYERRFAAGVLVLGLALAAAVLCVGNCNPDDYNFFHRALVQLDHPQQPFALTETGLVPAGLPQLSILHAMTSYEPGMAMSGQLLGVDPLAWYQNGGAAIGVLFMTVVLALLYRHVRLSPWIAFLSTVMAVVYMATDLRLPRSYGNILLYCWNGKVLLWGVFLPWTIVLALRFLRRPRWDRWLPLALAGVCAPGLTGSGLFLFPVEVFCISLAYVLGCVSWKRVRRAAMVNCAAIYCLTIVALSLIGVIPRPANVDVWTSGGFPAEWWPNLGLIYSHGSVLGRDAILLLIIPWFALPRPLARAAVRWVLAIVLVVANPLMGPLWMKIVTPGAYWRFAFVLPMAWYAGLVAASLFSSHGSRFRIWCGRSMTVVALVAMAIAWRQAVTWPLAATCDLCLKSPWTPRLPPRELAFARSASAALRGRYILGPSLVSVSVALLEPSACFHAVRGTQHIFANAAQPEEGRRRIAAQQAVTLETAERNGSESTAALQAALASGVDAIIVVDAEPVRSRLAAALAASHSGTWHASLAESGYALFLRKKE